MQNFGCLGRLVKDPEVTVMQVKGEDVKVARYTVAVNRDRNKDEADFFNCEVWRKGAEVAEKYLRSGKRIHISGKIRQDHYDGKDGQKKVAWKVIVESQEIIDWPENTENNAAVSGQAVSNQPTQQTTQTAPYSAAPVAYAATPVNTQGKMPEAYAPVPNPVPAQPQNYPQNNGYPNGAGFMPTFPPYAPVSAPVNPPAGYTPMTNYPDDTMPF